MRAYYPFLLDDQTYHVLAVPAEDDNCSILITLERAGEPAGRLRITTSREGQELAALIGLACAQMHARGLDREAIAAGGETTLAFGLEPPVAQP